MKINIENFLNLLSIISITIINEIDEIINEFVSAFLLSDSIYLNNVRIITIFKNMDCAWYSITKYLNQKLIEVYYYIENMFEIYKNRFRILTHSLKCVTENIIRTITLITIIYILHNFLIDVYNKMKIISDLWSEEERFMIQKNKNMIDE